jgi:hypothetical protein
MCEGRRLSAGGHWADQPPATIESLIDGAGGLVG